MKSLYIGNLAFRASEDDIRQAISSWIGPSSIQRVSIPIDKETSRTRGFAFVDFREDGDIARVLEHDGAEISGRTVRLREAEERPKGARGASGGGGQRNKPDRSGQDRRGDERRRRGDEW